MAAVKKRVQGVLEQLECIEKSFQEVLQTFMSCSHHFESIFKQFHTPDVPFNTSSSLSCSSELIKKQYENSVQICEILKDYNHHKKKKSGFNWVVKLAKYIDTAVIPLYEKYIRFWVWKIQALEQWTMNNEQFHAALAEFQNAINETNLSTESVLQLSKTILRFPTIEEGEATKKIKRKSCLIERGSRTFLSVFFTVPILRASALDRLLYHLSQEYIPEKEKNALLLSRKKYSEIVKLVDTFESRYEIMDQISKTFPAEISAKVSKF